MHLLRSFPRAASLAAISAGAILWSGCSDALQAPTAPYVAMQATGGTTHDIAAAIAAQERYTQGLMRNPSIVGTAVGLSPGGRAVVRIYLSTPGVRGIPASLDGIPVVTEVSGQFVALSDPTSRARPAPLGFSIGHPQITAGTIGARVKDAAGGVYILSNNHVLANSNQASIGDPSLQPGPYDGGQLSDAIATLHAFAPIVFTSTASNTMDAAIALSSTANLGNATPADDGYGMPSAAIFGDSDGDGRFDDRNALLNVKVQKYGRTTKLTKGSITGINGTFTVCYASFFGFCLQAARFVDQLVVSPGSFSGGGDSGSLIVTDDADRSPVALLFAGSSTQTIANRIDLVLSHFGVTIDGEQPGPPPPPPPPPDPVTDIAIEAVTAPASVVIGDVVTVNVSVKNVGNQDVAESFEVTLEDVTDGVVIGTRGVAGLTTGASANLTYSWSTAGATTGAHTLRAAHGFSDEVPTNDTGMTSVSVNEPNVATGMHVGNLDGWNSSSTNAWSAIVEVTVHDAAHSPLNGATVVGTWSIAGLNSDTCTTGELGGNGSCIFLFPSLKRSVKSVTFTVTSVTKPGQSYKPGENHDDDGSSNGTSVTVNRP